MNLVSNQRRFVVSIELKVDQIDVPMGPAANLAAQRVQVGAPTLVDALLYRALANELELGMAVNQAMSQLGRFLDLLASGGRSESDGGENKAEKEN